MNIIMTGKLAGFNDIISGKNIKREIITPHYQKPVPMLLITPKMILQIQLQMKCH